MLCLCTAEDLIIMKACENRPQDRVDLRGILIRQGHDCLDWNYIWSNLTPLVEINEEPEILEHLKSLIRESRDAGQTTASMSIWKNFREFAK
jgi:hypothetical protein